mmetsp:Transcript_11996/g.21612  ORF Transcript_11996/g.21612 Transcript_11996/m.21612 type:complete len:245 (-) Transcript_11996:773-1507(-)
MLALCATLTITLILQGPSPLCKVLSQHWFASCQCLSILCPAHHKRSGAAGQGLKCCHSSYPANDEGHDLAYGEHRTCSMCRSYGLHHKGRGKSTHGCARQRAQEYDHADKATPIDEANVRIRTECIRRSYGVDEAKTAHSALHICEAIEPLDYVSNHADNTFHNAQNHTGHSIIFSLSVFPHRLHDSFQGSHGSNSEGAQADGAERCDEGYLQAAADGGNHHLSQSTIFRKRHCKHKRMRLLPP